MVSTAIYELLYHCVSKSVRSPTGNPGGRHAGLPHCPSACTAALSDGTGASSAAADEHIKRNDLELDPASRSCLTLRPSLDMA